VTDRQMDGQTANGPTYCGITALCAGRTGVASRDKNCGQQCF